MEYSSSQACLSSSKEPGAAARGSRGRGGISPHSPRVRLSARLAGQLAGAQCTQRDLSTRDNHLLPFHLLEERVWPLPLLFCSKIRCVCPLSTPFIPSPLCRLSPMVTKSFVWIGLVTLGNHESQLAMRTALEAQSNPNWEDGESTLKFSLDSQIKCAPHFLCRMTSPWVRCR